MPRWAEAGRRGWRWDGRVRPDFAEPAGPGRESVWDYPRPPRWVPDDRLVSVRFGETLVAETAQAIRVLETASPPTFYLPPDSVRWEHLEPAGGSSACEWKGVARYWDVAVGSVRLERVAWSYPDPFPEFERIRDHVSFYPGRIECYVAGERVRPQPGRFYGGWITSELAGPFKGTPGSEGW